MRWDESQTERQHRAINKESPPPSLIPKRCACGTSITARQLNQHGKCEHCRLTVGLQDGDLDKLRFMLGATANSSGKPGSRNHYLCGAQDRAAMERLVASGLARVGAPLLTSLYYHATKDGCRATGLDPAGIARAMNAAPYVFEPADASIRIASQVAAWRKEIARLNGLIAAASGPIWQKLTAAGQVESGDTVRFDLCGETKAHKVCEVLHAGTDKEEIIYHRRNNWYLITSMSIKGTGSQKNVEFAKKSPRK